MVSEDIPAHALGGLAKHVVALAHALQEQGHELVLMGRDTPTYEDCAAEVGFKGQFIAGFPDPFRLWGEGRLGMINPIKRPLLARRIARAILTHGSGFDVVHYHGHLPMVARYLPESIPFVQTRHDQGSDCIRHTRFTDLGICRETSASACAACLFPDSHGLRAVISAAAVRRYRKDTIESFRVHPVIFVSEFLRSNLKRTAPDAGAGGVVIHNFVDEVALEAVRQNGPSRSESGVVIHIAGRLDRAKGIAEFLAMLAPVMPAGWCVNVYGDGPVRAETQRAHASEGIRFFGHRPNKEVLAALNLASVVVVPSILEEACGTVILEALRMDKVCLALGHGGTPELVRYGSVGQLRLFDEMKDLVTALVGTQSFRVAPGGDSADVRQRLPDLLAVYERLRRPR